MITETPRSKKSFWQASLTFKKSYNLDVIENISESFFDDTVSVFTKEPTDTENSIIEIVFLDKPELSLIKEKLSIVSDIHEMPNILNDIDINLAELPDQDWLLHVHQEFPPLTIENIFIYGSHYEDKIPSNFIPLKIDAATAFGSGEHATTAGCLTALQSLARQHSFSNILDMGCGSGILSIAAAKIWSDSHIIATDIDSESVIVTNKYAEINDCTDKISCFHGDGYKTTDVQKNAPYDLIIANILAKPLIDMSGELYSALKDGGYCVLSGLLQTQKEAVLKAHTEHGLLCIQEFPIGEWQTLILHKQKT